MRIVDLFSLSYGSIIRTRGRAMLTMLGIIIGIASVILMLAIGQAAQGYLLSQIAAFGSDVIFIANGKGDEKDGGPPSNNVKQTLTMADYRALYKTPWIRSIAASSISKDLVSYGSNNTFAQIDGTTPGELVIFTSRAAAGRFFDEEEVNGQAKVIVLGAGIAKRLFEGGDAIGKTVKLNKQNFRVIGVMEEGGTRFFTKVDDQVYLPITSFLALYNKDRINFISIKPQNVTVDEAKEQIRWLLRDTHRLNNPQGILAKDDFKVASQEDAVRSAAVIGNILQILLASIAAISLIVGGIGIMNIMLVTVTERTQEIGLRKSIGATRANILGQFLIESILLTFAGGVVGIVLGLTLSYGAIHLIATFQSGWKFIFPTSAVILATVVSTLIGLVFGIYPARKAARLSPIEALRYE
jgi:putative ABC transport system permease protein